MKIFGSNGNGDGIWVFHAGQYPADQDMQKTFAESCEQARIADELGYTYLLKRPSITRLRRYRLFNSFPFLSRIMVEAPNAKLVSGIVLLPLHKPLDIAEQLASVDVMSGGRLVFGSGIGYRDVEFKAFGTKAKDRGKRFEECLNAIKRLWTEDFVTMKGSHFELDEALPVRLSRCKNQCRRSGSAPM